MQLSLVIISILILIFSCLKETNSGGKKDIYKNQKHNNLDNSDSLYVDVLG